MRNDNIAGFPVRAPQLPARPLCIPCYSLFRAAGIAAQVLVAKRGIRAGGRPAGKLPDGRELRRRTRRSVGGALPPGPRCAEQAEGGVELRVLRRADHFRVDRAVLVDDAARHRRRSGAIWGGAIWGGAIWGGAIWGGAIWGGAIWGGAIWGDAIWGDAIWGDA